MKLKKNEEHLGWISASGKRRMPIQVISIYNKPAKKEKLEIDEAIIKCVLGIDNGN